MPVVDFVSETSCLGGAGNVAANLASLGARVTPFGVTGADEAGRALRAALAAAGMADKGVVADARRVTTLKTRIIARHQQVVRVDRERRDRFGSFPRTDADRPHQGSAAAPRRPGGLRLRQRPDHRRARRSRARRVPPPGLARAGEAENFAPFRLSRRDGHRLQQERGRIFRHARAQRRKVDRGSGTRAAGPFRMRRRGHHAGRGWDEPFRGRRAAALPRAGHKFRGELCARGPAGR